MGLLIQGSDGECKLVTSKILDDPYRRICLVNPLSQNPTKIFQFNVGFTFTCTVILSCGKSSWNPWKNT